MDKTIQSQPQLRNSRYTDISDEPVTRLLSPIKGYEAVPLVPLEQALSSVSKFFDGIQDYIYVAKENCKNPTDGLNQDEAASIYLYTMQFDVDPSLYKIFNTALRSEDRETLKPWFPFLKLFLTALYKLPSYTQTVWRGVRDVDLSFKYPTGTKFVWWGVSSCTLSVDILKSDWFLGTQGIRTLFSIECKAGKQIGSHSHFQNREQEVIIMPGSYFEVMGQLNPAVGLLIIQLKEIDPPIVFVKPPFTHLRMPSGDTTYSSIYQSGKELSMKMKPPAGK
jgi:hypothetical protein